MSEIASRRQILGWEIAGVCFIILIAGPMHEMFAQSGNWRPLALIAPVNESIWEHQKMNFWPGLVFVAFQYWRIGKRIPNFWTGKLVGLVVTPVLAVTTYVVYIELERASVPFAPNLVVMASLSMLSVCIGQAACYRVLIAEPIAKTITRYTTVVYAILAVAFSTLTYFPPQMYLFEHNHHYEPIGQYGIDVDPEVGPHPWE